MYASRTPLASEQATRVASATLSPDALPWTLRIGAFLCFVGHGAFGIMTKHAWLPYFAVANIGPETAYRLMPLIGAMDITMGLLVLFTPRPAVLFWMSLWTTWTALLRPLSGESGWEAVERAGNYGVPIALIVLLAPWNRVSGFFTAVRFRALTPSLLRRVEGLLVAVVAMLLVGHGVLGLEDKPGLIANYASILPADIAARLTPVIGGAEIALALLVVRWPSVTLALSIAVWKLASESLFIAAGQPFWEIVERGGSYAAPVALAIATLLAGHRRDDSSTTGANGTG